MKVSQLILALELLPQDARVLVDGYEGGMEEFCRVASIEAFHDPTPDWWEGDWHLASDNADHPVEICVYFPGRPSTKGQS